MNPKRDRTGQTYVTNEGYTIKIIKYVNNTEVLIEFQDDYKYKKWSRVWDCKQGRVKNPFHKSVYGVGYLGVMSDGTVPITKINGKMTREYNVWHDMIKRCYSETSLQIRPQYKDCIVDEKLHSYSYFLEHINEIVGYDLWLANCDYELDKDMWYKEQGIETTYKIYSLETIRFIPHSDNTHIARYGKKKTR